MDHKDDLARSLVKGIMAYGLGRNIEFSDADDVEALVSHLRKNDYRARSMIHGLVQSELFQSK